MRNRRAAYSFGLEAEFLAAFFLRLKGYRILAKRFKASGAEIDVIAQKGDTLAFIEVKARPTREEALLAITPTKLRQMARGARAFLGRQNALPTTIRADAILITPWHLPEHIINIGELPLD